MTFRAKIRRDSAIWRMWRLHHRVGGSVCAIPFHWAPGNNYVSDVLDTDQIVAAASHRDIELETTVLALPDDVLPDLPGVSEEPEEPEGAAPDPLEALPVFKRQRGRPRKYSSVASA